MSYETSVDLNILQPRRKKKKSNWKTGLRVITKTGMGEKVGKNEEKMEAKAFTHLQSSTHEAFVLDGQLDLMWRGWNDETKHWEAHDGMTGLLAKQKSVGQGWWETPLPNKRRAGQEA